MSSPLDVQYWYTKFYSSICVISYRLYFAHLLWWVCVMGSGVAGCRCRSLLTTTIWFTVLVTLLHKVSQTQELPRVCQKSTVPNKECGAQLWFILSPNTEFSITNSLGYWYCLTTACLSQKSASACSYLCFILSLNTEFVITAGLVYWYFLALSILISVSFENHIIQYVSPSSRIFTTKSVMFNTLSHNHHLLLAVIKFISIICLRPLKTRYEVSRSGQNIDFWGWCLYRSGQF